MSQLKFAAIAWQSDEYQQTVDLRLRVLRLPLGLKFSLDDRESEKDQAHYAAWMDDQLVGCVIIVSQKDHNVKLRQMAIEPSHQRSGIGTFLMKQVEKEMVRLGKQVITLHARKAAIGFYQELGYKTNGEEFVEVSIPHVLMTKNLLT